MSDRLEAEFNRVRPLRHGEIEMVEQIYVKVLAAD